jgi:hypothetical protein
MKHSRVVLAAMATISLSLTAIAQTGDPPTSDDLPGAIARARCAYTPAEATCTPASYTNRGVNMADSTPLAQLSRRAPGDYPPPRRRSVRYPYPAYPVPTVSGRHVAIGAAIGLTLGVIAGSRTGAKDALALGTVTGGVGAFVGLLIPAFPQRQYYPGPDDGDDDALRRNPHRANSRTAHHSTANPDPVERSQADGHVPEPILKSGEPVDALSASHL